METATGSFRQLAANSKQFTRRLLTIGENRLELLAVEVQEERERLLHAFLLALTAAIVIGLPARSSAFWLVDVMLTGGVLKNAVVQCYSANMRSLKPKLTQQNNNAVKLKSK